MARMQSTNRFIEILADGLSISLFRLGNGFSQHRQAWRHHRQIDKVPAENTVIVPSIRIGEQFARQHIARRECRDSANIIIRARFFQFNTPFEDDFKFGVLCTECGSFPMPIK